MPAQGTPTTDLFNHRRAQNIKQFLILLFLIICLGFFNVYANFYQISHLEKYLSCLNNFRTIFVYLQNYQAFCF